MPEIYANKGVKTAGSNNALSSGEVRQATGVYYKEGDSTGAHIIPDSETFDTLSGQVKGVALAQFDDNTGDKLLAYAGTTLSSATPGATGAFTDLITNLDEDATEHTLAHNNDLQYWGNGYDFNRVIKSDGTVRRMGMLPPTETPTTATSAASATITRPTATISNAGWTDPGNTWDSSTDTYGRADLNAAGTATLVVGTWASDTRSDRELVIDYLLSGIFDQEPGAGGGDFDFGIGGGPVDAGFSARIQIEVSEDNGDTYTEILNETRTTYSARTLLRYTLTGSDDNVIWVRYTLTYNSGQSPTSFRVFDTRVEDGSTAANQTTTAGGMFYAIREWDALNGIASTLGPETTRVELTAENQVTLTWTTAAKNSTSTHWQVYRTADGGTSPQDFGFIGQVPIGTLTFKDVFSNYLPSEQPQALIPLVSVQDATQQDTKYFPRDSPPPAAAWMFPYKGSMLFIQRNGRSLFISMPNRPESVPEINLITSFPFKEHDQLVAGVTVGDSIILGCKQLMLRLDDLPRFVRGIYNGAEAIPISGQPGLISRYGLTDLSVVGEDSAAWISYKGIHLTNGVRVRLISSDIDWDRYSGVDLSTAFLHWWKDEQILVFGVPASSEYWYLHVRSEHLKNGGDPSWTGPHTGSLRCAASGLVSSIPRLWFGHNSNGEVQTAHAKTVGSGCTIDYGRQYANGRDFEAVKVKLDHSDFGIGEECTITWHTEDDDDFNDGGQEKSKTVPLAGQKKSGFFVGMAGEWHQITLSYTGAGLGSIQEIQAGLNLTTRSGAVK